MITTSKPKTLLAKLPGAITYIYSGYREGELTIQRGNGGFARYFTVSQDVYYRLGKAKGWLELDDSLKVGIGVPKTIDDGFYDVNLNKTENSIWIGCNHIPRYQFIKIGQKMGWVE